MHLPADTFLKALLASSWQASLVILLILLVRPLLGRRVPARWRSWLWTLVLLRLLVPAFLLPPSPASLQNLAVVERPLEQAALALDRRGAGRQPPPRFLPQGPVEGESTALPAAPTPPAKTARSWWQLAALLWLAGATLAGLWIFTATLLLHRRLRRHSALVADDIRRVWERCCVRSGVRISDPRGQRQSVPLNSGAPAAEPPPPFHPFNGTDCRWPRGLKTCAPPRLVQTSAVTSPALVGVFRPLLLVPRETSAALSAADWEHIFLHELAHFRRGDHWTHAVQLLALCAHWFNPLVWLGFRALRADRELAADEWALRHLAERPPAAYGETLLKVLAAQSRHTVRPGLVGIMEDGAQMRQRLRHIVAFGPRRFFGSLVGIVLVLGLGAMVLGQQAVDLAGYAGLTPAESLVVAARRGDQEAVGQLLRDGTDINAVVKMRGERTALTEAVAAHDLPLVRLLVAKGADVQLKPGSGSAPLIVALKKGWPDMADYLRGKGATCAAEYSAAAQGDAPAIEQFLATGQPGYDQVKLLGEIAAAHGQRALFAKLYDALKQLPEQRDYFPFSRDAFTVAVANGHRDVIEELLARDPNLTPHEGVIRLSPGASRVPGMREWLNEKGVKVPEYTDGERLIDAAEREDLPEIRRLLAAGVDVHYRGEADWTPLTKAATWGCPRAVSLLLENGADPNGRRYNNYSTLELSKNVEVAELLFKAGAKVTAKDIGYCVTFGTVELVQWFIDHGVDPAKVKDDDSDPTLLFRTRTPEIAELLIARGVPVNAKNKSGRTALFSALQMNENPARLVTVLLKHGADPNERSQGGTTPLMLAPDAATVDVLVAAGADLNAKNDQGNGVIAGGAHTSNPTRMEALFRHGLKLDAASGAAQLMNAIVLRHDLPAVKALLALGVDPHTGLAWEGRIVASPLAAAICNGHFDIAAVLRAAGAKDVGALSEAAARGDLARMQALLAAGADVNELSGNGMTPLRFAVRQGQSAATGLLLERGADVNRFDSAGMTAFIDARSTLLQVEHAHFSPISRLEPPAAKKALDEIIAAISARQPDFNTRNEEGETVLMVAAKVGNLMFNFVEAKADVNAQRPDGMTALMLAIVSQPKDASRTGAGSVGIADRKDSEIEQHFSARAYVVKTLLENGADLTLRNAAGQTALDLARENGNEEILGLLAKFNR